MREDFETKSSFFLFTLLHKEIGCFWACGRRSEQEKLLFD